MPHPCCSPAMPCCVNSHMPCRAPAILRQCCVLRESQHGSRKVLQFDWYASDYNLRRTPRGSRKKPNAGRSPHAACGRPTLIHACHAMPHCAMALRSHFQNSIVVACHGHGMPQVNQTRLLYVNQMGKTQSKSLTAWHCRGTAWAQHGKGMICVN
jgi:hypothetical protein